MYMYVRYGYMQMFEVATGQLRSADVICDQYIVAYHFPTRTNTALSRTKRFLGRLLLMNRDPYTILQQPRKKNFQIAYDM